LLKVCLYLNQRQFIALTKSTGNAIPRKDAVVEISKLKKELEDLKAKQNQRIGQRDNLLARLKSEFGVSTVTEAEALLVALEQQITDETAEYEKLKAEYAVS
jgi:predicted transcriptional regulator